MPLKARQGCEMWVVALAGLQGQFDTGYGARYEHRLYLL